MKIPVILAHGAFGPFDEIIFLGVAILFFVMIGISWIKSRNMEALMDEDETSKEGEHTTPANTSDKERFM